MQKRFTFSIFQLVALGLSTLIGLIVGSSFIWAMPDASWNHLITGFLWVLLISAGTGLARSVRERIQRGEWRRGIAVGCEMTFPATTMYILAVLLASLNATEVLVLSDGASVSGKPDLLLMAPIFYSITLMLAVIIGPMYVLTSPFGRKDLADVKQES